MSQTSNFTDFNFLCKDGITAKTIRQILIGALIILLFYTWFFSNKKCNESKKSKKR